MMTDPIADMLTRIRNAVRVERPAVEIPFSHVKQGLAEVLKREGYIWEWTKVDGQPVSHLDSKHFCVQCHEYASVSIDCFDCHASKPRAKKAGQSL